MSLINDALKRVSEAERGKPAEQTDFATRSLQPAEYERRGSPALWIMLPVLLVAVGVGGFLLAKQAQPAQPTFIVQTKAPAPFPAVQQYTSVLEPKATPAAAAAPSSLAPVVATATATAPTTTIATNVSPTANATPAPAASAASAPTQPAPVPVATGPTFRLKGILYTKNPTALINDGSAGVGGEIDGGKVTKIDRTSVELEYQGKVTVLKLGVRQ